MPFFLVYIHMAKHTKLKLHKSLNIYLSKHLRAREVQCKCTYSECNSMEFDSRLTGIDSPFERLRASDVVMDQPLHITSGYRCPRHNLDVNGSSPTSMHMKGQALDILKPDGIPLDVFAMAAKRAGFDVVLPYIEIKSDLGVITRPAFIHCHMFDYEQPWNGKHFERKTYRNPH